MSATARPPEGGAAELDRDFYRGLRFLVVDDQATARQSLRICAQMMGAFVVDFSATYQDAIGRIRRNPPDVILCDYLLGSDRSGQQLLEELRRLDLLPDHAVFMMVTAEQSYEQVVAAVELVPDDYIIKPFSPERLKFRLDRAVRRKHFFEPFLRARRTADYPGAERFIQEHRDSEAARPYRFELLRQNAELQLAKGDVVAAQAAFAEILQLHPFPWAKAGMAKALLRQNRLQEARDVIEEVVGAAPQYFDAFDLKARICIDMGDYGEAQKTVQQTSERTTRNYLRKRLLADAALLNGDGETARAAIADVIENDPAPGAVSVADRLMLARSHLEAGDLLSAEKALGEVTSERLAVATLDEKISCQALWARLAPEREGHRVRGMRDACMGAALGATAQVDLVYAALLLEDHALATSAAAALFASDEIRRVFRRVKELFEAHGMEPAFRELQRQAALERIGAAARGATGDPPGGREATGEPPPDEGGPEDARV